MYMKLKLRSTDIILYRNQKGAKKEESLVIHKTIEN